MPGLLRKQQAEAGDIVLLYGDESEALTHPYLARAWAKSGPDLRVPAPGQAKKVAMLGSLDHVTHQLIVHTSPTKRSSDFIAHLEQLDRLFGPQPGRQAKPVVPANAHSPPWPPAPTGSPSSGNTPPNSTTSSRSGAISRPITLGSDARRGLKDHPTVKPTIMLVDALLDLTNRVTSLSSSPRREGHGVMELTRDGVKGHLIARGDWAR